MPTFRAEVNENVIRVEGEIDLVSAPALAACFAVVGHSTVILDLTNTTFLDASGLSVIFAAADRLADEGHDFGVRGAHGLVRRLFHLTDTSHLLVD